MPGEFSYVVGHPWPDNPTSICTYTHGTTVRHGTMRDAEAFRQYVDHKTGVENFIYKLTKVEKTEQWHIGG